MRLKTWQLTILATLALVALLGVSCGGGGSTVVGGDLGGSDDPPGLVGDISDGVDPSDVPASEPFRGIIDDAPLGTDPEYQVQSAEDLIQTRLVSHSASGIKTASDDPLFWVAVVARGEEPVPGLASPPFYEGDEVDLYMRYQVFEGQLTISREWHLDAAGLHFVQPEVEHAQAGAYEAVFPFTLPYGSEALEAVFVGVWGLPRGTSSVVIPDMSDFREASFEILDTPILDPINYPAEPDEENGDPVNSMPDWITVDWTSDTEVHVECEKELSNVVLAFEDGVHEKWDDLDQDPDRVYTGDFWGTGENEGKTIVTVWVKAGNNASGDGPGYGERFDTPEYNELGLAQLAWEDLLSGSDYDYNDFVGRMRATEFRNTSNELVQIQLTLKAIARSAGYDSDWQFNVNAAFPTVNDVDVIAIVNQYYADGTPHGYQRVYASAGGMSVPVFTPIRDALPNPPGSYATNGIAGTQYIDGDYAEVTIILNTPMAQGTYTPIPYKPELRVHPYSGGTYTIGLWTQPGDPVDSNGRPLAFIIPDTYAWPLEGKQIWNCYDGFPDWIQWIGNPDTAAPNPVWYDETPVADLVFSRDKFTP